MLMRFLLSTPYNIELTGAGYEPSPLRTSFILYWSLTLKIARN